MSAKINNPPAKILLNQSTKVSLNDRFSQLSKVRRTSSAPVKQQQTVKMNKLRVGSGGSSNNNHTNTARSNLLQKTATARNRRLALQMANRPSVQAALKLKKKSINQRLGKTRAQALVNRGRPNNAGGGIAARLSGLKRGANGKGLLRQRVGRGGGIRRRLGGAATGGIQSRLSGGSLVIRRGGNGLRRGVNRGGRGGALRARLNNIVNKNGQQAARNGGGSLNSSLTTRRNAISAAGNAGGTARFYNRNNNNNNKNNGRYNNNNNRGGRYNNRRGGRQNRGGRQQQNQQPKSKESLDTDLDQYMAKSKSSLDADLNNYMSQAH